MNKTTYTHVEIRHHQERLECALEQVMQEMKTLSGEGERLDAVQSDILDTIRDHIGHQGKRLRPLVFIAGYKAYTTHIDEQVYRAAISIELLHDFILVHDDIVDNADMRRGHPSLQRYLEMTVGTDAARARSDAFALVAGDLIYTCAMHTFLGIDADAGRVTRALRELTRAGIHTAMGQFHEMSLIRRGIDTVEEEEVFSVYERKTAQYSFAAPLAAGAILGGAPHEDVDALRRSAVGLGRGFQLYDDLIDCLAQPEDTGKDAMGDLFDGVKTIPLVRLYRQATEEQRQWLARREGTRTLNDEDARRLQRMLYEYGIPSRLEQEATKLYEDALDEIKDVLPSRDAFSLLLRLMFSLFGTHMRYLHQEEGRMS
jgi:geranylgeranyl pyrophosphate synthase